MGYDKDGWELEEFYHNNDGDKVWWTGWIKFMPDGGVNERMGEFLFSFDKKRVYNLFRDYPHALTPEEKELFDKENPYWADFFSDRS